MVNIWKFRLIVLVSNRIEYWSNYSIWFEISNIRTALSLLLLSGTVDGSADADADIDVRVR